MRKIIAPLAAALLITACAPIQHQAIIEQPTGAVLTAGPGDVMARVDKQRNLENLFGRADIYGRKTNEGYSELHFAGVGPHGETLLYRTDVNIVSNETTMSRSPFSSSYTSSRASGSAMVAGPAVYGQASGSSSTVAVAPISDYHAVIPQGSIPVVLPAGSPDVSFEGHAIHILSASPGMVSYQIDNSTRS